MKLKITVDGKLYEVDVEVSEPERAKPGFVAPIGQVRVPAAPVAPTASPSAAVEKVADESKVCRSPFAGTVSRVEAQVGQKIEPNGVLVVIEAMKMETSITAPAAGKIAKINVAAGDAVKQGQVLVEFE
ncbi:biotin/lipoyl-containing protein [Paludisphaera rhizosphaerae]|uniref:biotin/lipoyl-containing protein n=1 Tax=Paludisphaera rhizosphaerae TaxID=2711216 RepID=UPI0013EA3351|nr:biotin/lipoyl-containing protein [Paludisphaera rhizosphaerae]